MFFLKNNSQKQLDTLSKSQAVIEFDTSGNILHANKNFLDAVGYTLAEIKGQHHRLFVGSEYASSPAYKQFWEKLASGEYCTSEFQRFGKNNKEIWIQASYNPIFDMNNKVFKIVKYATDITAQKLKTADYTGQLNAISKSQAVIEFDTSGNILHANKNFLDAVGYTLAEIKGQHHRLFVGSEYASSPAYKQFWEKLASGEHCTSEFQRFGKNNKEIWIQASYNPIFDMNHKVFKVVKYATDITAQKLKTADYTGQLNAISKSQAVIEFDTSGNILHANKNFLDAVGYTLAEIKGQHHRLFVGSEYAGSPEYKQFWEKLASGEHCTSEFQRFGKNNKEIWIQASYNPIFDMNNKVFKIVKYATDITAQKMAYVASTEITNHMHSNIQSVAAAAEELTASINEISRNMTMSKTLLMILFVKQKMQMCWH